VWLLLLLHLPAAAAADDVQLWTEAGVRVDFDERFRLKFDQHVRFDSDVGSTKSIMPEVAFSWRPAKFLRLEAGYRFIAEPVDTEEGLYVEAWHRVFADVKLRLRLKPVTLRYRLRFQEHFGRSVSPDSDLEYTHAVRNKAGVEVKLGSGVVPFTSAEIFIRPADEDGPLRKWRVTAGIDWKLGGHVLTCFYRLEDFLDDSDNPRRHILGLGYHHAF
jgi:hypothetical protein